MKTGGQYLQLDAIEVTTPRTNNSHPAIAYTTSQWTTSGNRAAGDVQDDVKYATANGAALDYTFTGTGIDLIGPAEGTTSVSIYIDNVLVSSVNCTDAGYIQQVALASVTNLPPGQHVLKVVKTGGQYLQIDALQVRAPRINNEGGGLVYSSYQWSTSGNRNAGDFQNDVTYTTATGAYVQFTFTGTGADVIGPVQDVTTADIFIDGALVATIDRNDPEYTAQVALASVRGLAPGTHVLKVVKTGGTYLQIDAVQVRLG
ncbi:hypothetical protein [Salinibacterium sp.]|uniref:hypothetical protein n=1 Tax=Salinibacterium sp. TaxID=1915057 RepID=UPI00286AB185|nr:hypothetical protein [Salinibacterium sp.]